MRNFLPILLLLLLACPLAADGPLPEVSELGVAELHGAYTSGCYTIAAVTRAYLARIAALDRAGPELNSVLSLDPTALEVAEALYREWQAGRIRSPLHGIPVLLKDNIDTANPPTTSGSVFLKDSVPPEDAHIVTLLREAGAVILGKTNLSEWANFHSSFSSSGWSRLGDQVKNPYGPTRNPCGSSSGSGAAAAASLAALTIGTDTGGSIIWPAGANGIVGLKPTVNLWSRHGIIPISHSLDSAGPMTRTVADDAVLLGLLAGGDQRDPINATTDGHRHADYRVFLDPGGLRDRRMGFCTAGLGRRFRVDELTLQAIGTIEAAGAEIIEIDSIVERDIGGEVLEVLLYEFRNGLDAYFSRLGGNAALTSFDELVAAIDADPEETARFDRQLIYMAAERGGLDSKTYRKALATMLEHSRESGIDRVMDEHQLDAIVAPTGSPAWKIDLVLGDNFSRAISGTSPSMGAGYPIVTVPMGSIDDLPVGLSFFGCAWSEPALISMTYAFEQATGQRRPPPWD